MSDIGNYIDRFIKGEFAKYFRPVATAEVVVQSHPIWVRAAGAEFFFGIKRDFLNKLVIERKVTAKKADRLVLFRFDEINAAIDEMKAKGV